jgi:hypothetical protein
MFPLVVEYPFCVNVGHYWQVEDRKDGADEYKLVRVKVRVSKVKEFGNDVNSNVEKGKNKVANVPFPLLTLVFF